MIHEVQTVLKEVKEKIKRIVYKGYDFLMCTKDQLRGVDFQQKILTDNKSYAPYAPTSSYLLVPLYWYLYPKVKSKREGIIDIGCGKGKMLEFFSKLPFKYVHGLEYSEPIVQIARCNIEKLDLNCKVFCEDAKTFADYDNYTWFYLFYPFDEEIMKLFIAHLKENVQKYPRKVHLIYHFPAYHDLLIEENFMVEDEIRFLSKNSIKIYCYEFSKAR